MIVNTVDMRGFEVRDFTEVDLAKQLKRRAADTPALLGRRQGDYIRTFAANLYWNDVLVGDVINSRGGWYHQFTFIDQQAQEVFWGLAFDLSIVEAHCGEALFEWLRVGYLLKQLDKGEIWNEPMAGMLDVSYDDRLSFAAFMKPAVDYTNWKVEVHAIADMKEFHRHYSEREMYEKAGDTRGFVAHLRSGLGVTYHYLERL